MINECRESRKQSLNFCVSLTAHIGDELTTLTSEFNGNYPSILHIMFGYEWIGYQ